MKKLCSNHSAISQAAICLLGSLLLSVTEVRAQSYKLFAVSDLDQIFEDGYNIPHGSDTISLFGIRGEVLSAQFVIGAQEDLTNVALDPVRLKHEVSGSYFPGKNIEWNFVGSIPLTINSSIQPKQTVIRQAPARFPDYLMAERQININKGTYRPVWLTITIPGNATAGTWFGKVSVKTNRGVQFIPVNLKVYPLNLPEERHLKVIIWDNRSKFGQYHGVKEEYSAAWFEILRKYAENMVAHRQNSFQVAMNTIACKKLSGGGYEFEYSLFDKIAMIYWNTGKMDLLELGLSDNRSELTNRGTQGFASTEIFLNDIKLRNMGTNDLISVPGKELIPYLLPSLQEHLRQKGWLQKSVLHICDEPAVHNARSWIEISRYVHKYAPDLKRIDALCTAFVLSDLEIGVPKLDHLDAGYDIYRKWQEKGNELWFYTVGVHQGSNYPNKTIDMPVIGSRILHWLNYKYDAPGYLHWGWNQWSGDPYNDSGENIGDAWHVYPYKDSVLNSIRWEQTRNGIQDYECFKMLEQKVKALKDSLGNGFEWIDPAQRGKEIAGLVTMNLVRYSTDPKVLYKAKADLINELVEFNASPGIYVQTSPPENGTVINHSVVELLGWAEPGSEVTVNKQKLVVGGDGFFVLRDIIFIGGKLQITVKKDGKEKTIIRRFNVTY